jgi:hypothetical protein
LVDALRVALGGGYIVVVAVDEDGTQFMSLLLRNWDEIKWVSAGRSCRLAV